MLLYWDSLVPVPKAPSHPLNTLLPVRKFISQHMVILCYLIKSQSAGFDNCTKPYRDIDFISIYRAAALIDSMAFTRSSTRRWQACTSLLLAAARAGGTTE